MALRKRDTNNLIVPDLEELTIAEAQELLSNIEQELRERSSRKRSEALKQIRQIVQGHGLRYEDVISAIRTTATRKKAPPIYRNPDNPRQTWSGKGEAPDWFKSAKDKEPLKIT